MFESIGRRSTNMASKNIVRWMSINSKLKDKLVPSCKSLEFNDKITHTGQTFDPDDYRLARFAGRTKEVNDNWAINLIEQVPPKSSKERIVSCDGGNGPLGHPKVYINLDRPGNHTCGYCGLRFYKEDHH